MRDRGRASGPARPGPPDRARQTSQELLPRVHDELRRLARAHMAREAPGHSLAPTLLVHEAWPRLVEGDSGARRHGRA